MPTGGVMSSRAAPRMPANSGCENGGGAWALRVGVEAQPKIEPSASTPPARRTSRRVEVVIPATLHLGEGFPCQFQGPFDVLVRVRGADRSLLGGQREMVDPVVDQLAPVAAVEVEIVARGQVVPVDGNVVAEVRAERRADAADDGRAALLPVERLEPRLQPGALRFQGPVDL